MLKNISAEIQKNKCSYFKQAFPKIFSWKELERLLNLRPFVNSARFIPVNLEPTSWEKQAWMSDVNCFPPTMVEKFIRERVCYLSDASRANKKINSICKQLEKIFPDGAADAHIYFALNDKAKESFGIHYDYSHNLIIQVEGITHFKAWNINGNGKERIVNFLESYPNIDIKLNPGDAVFVPKHFYHEAVSITKRLSVSFPVNFDQGLKQQERLWISL